MWIQSITGILVARCETTLLRGCQCFSLSVRRCDMCGMYICDMHTHYRETYTGGRMHEYLLCKDCDFEFSTRQRSTFHRMK